MHYRWLITTILILSVTPVAPVLALELNDYPGARLVYSSREAVSDYTLALGTYRKVGGMMRVEHQRLAGILSRRTYQLPDNHSAAQGFEFFLRQLAGHSPRELYRCSGRECGQSNHWANDHFGILQLYGLDQYQYYGAFELVSRDQVGVYVTLYSVLRGNRRVFLQVEVLDTGERESYRVASTPDSLLGQLRRDGYISFLRLEDQDGKAQLGEQHLVALAAALTRAGDVAVAVVGHNYEAVSPEQQRQRSQVVADRVRRALAVRGVEEARLEAEGLGSLAPASRGDSRVRVDIVLQPGSAQ